MSVLQQDVKGEGPSFGQKNTPGALMQAEGKG
jgi:hypothetical protein